MWLGGEYQAGDPPSQGSDASSSELYNSSTGTWTTRADFNTTGNSQFGDDPIVLLPNGQILAGYINTGSTYVYNPASNSWSPTGSKVLRTYKGVTYQDRSDEESWVKQSDGSILSYDVYTSYITNATTGVGSAERYIPSTGTWIDAGNPPLMSGPGVGYELGPAFLLPDGRSWFTGANGVTAFYTPSTNSWAAGPAIPNGYVASDDPGAVLPNGHVLLAASPLGTLNAAGGYTFPAGTKVYEFDPTANNNFGSYVDDTPAIAGFDVAGINAYQTAMLVLPNGNVLMCNDSGEILDYSPAVGTNPAWQPGITSIVNGSGGNVFTLTGYRLNGTSEGAAYGDDAQMSTDYPIVELIDQYGTLTYAKTFNWTTTTVSAAGDTTPETVQFTLPPGDAVGAYRVAVCANGIISPFMLDVQMGAATTTNLAIQANANPAYLDVVANGSVVASFNYSLFSSLMISGDNLSDLIVINDATLTVPTTVDGGDANDFIRMETSGGSATFYGGNGNDDFDFSYYARNLSNVSTFTSVYGGAGTDNIFVYDNASTSTNTYSIGNLFVSRPGFNGFAYSSDVEALTVTTGTASDTVNITSTSSATSVYLSSTGGIDSVNIGSSHSVQGILGSIIVQNPPSYSNVSIDDGSDSSPRNSVLSATSLTGLAPAAISWTLANLNALNISGGSGGNYFYVIATPSNPHGVSTQLQTGAGNDSVDIEQMSGPLTVNTQTGVDLVNATGISQNLDTIQALLTVSGDSSSTMYLNDQSNPNFSSTSYGFSVTGFTRKAQTLVAGHLVTVNESIAASGLGNVVLYAGVFLNAVDVEGDSTPITIYGTANSSVIVSQVSENLNNIASTVTVYGEGTLPLTIEDQNNMSVVPVQNTLNATGLTSFAYNYVNVNNIPILFPYFAIVNYSNVGNVTFDGGTVANTYTIQNTAPLINTTLNAGSGRIHSYSRRHYRSADNQWPGRQ